VREGFPQEYDTFKILDFRIIIPCMCGRFILDSPEPLIAREFRIQKPAFNLKQSYNIAPSQTVYIILNDGKKKVVPCRWGFIPSWSQDQSVGYKMINARAETIVTKRSFRTAFRKHRCLIITNGFYEWRIKQSVKSPFFIRLKSGKPFGLAGIYNYWTPQDAEGFCTCAIITTAANEQIKAIHDRMPVIIPSERHDFWLDPHDHDENELVSLLKPYPPGTMEMYEVSSRVNTPRNNSSDNIKPISDKAG
jgi:putative SOS response-associated peptidase YedK